MGLGLGLVLATKGGKDRPLNGRSACWLGLGLCLGLVLVLSVSVIVLG